jgi:sarcosine oxidase gamma subunit
MEKRAHWLITDISDRIAVFSIKGESARDIIAAGCDPHLVRPGVMARTRFAGMANVIVEQWAEADYRLLIDVSVAGVLAAWLKSAARNLRSPVSLTNQAGSC